MYIYSMVYLIVSYFFAHRSFVSALLLLAHWAGFNSLKALTETGHGNNRGLQNFLYLLGSSLLDCP